MPKPSESQLVRAVTYGRQSKQREDESSGSPTAQREATAAHVAARGWQHVAHYEDVGASGYDPKAERPGLAAVLDTVHRGQAQAVVVYRLDRLTRQGVVEAVRLVGDLADHGAFLSSVHEPFLDTSTPMGHGIYALFAAMAEQESKNISDRTRATKEVLRRAGSATGGQRHYGYTPAKEMRDGLVLTVLQKEPREAGTLAEVAARVLAGASVSGEVGRLNREGIPTATGKEWSTSTLSRVLKSPTIAGYLATSKDGMVRDDDGLPVEAWEPIVEPSEWWALQEVLAGRAGGRGPRPTPTLLGGTDWFVCASCGSRMAGDRRAGNRGTYRCARHRRGSTACAGAAVSMPHTDDYIARTVWERADTLDPGDPHDLRLLQAVAARYAEEHVDPETEAARRAALTVISDTEAAMTQLDDDRAAGVFSGESGTGRYRRQVATLQDRGDAARAALEALPGNDPEDALHALLDVLSGLREPGAEYDSPESPWAAWTNDERRAFLALFLGRVTVAKGGGRGGGDRTTWSGHKRLRLTWADEVPPF